MVVNISRTARDADCLSVAPSGAAPTTEDLVEAAVPELESVAGIRGV